MTTRLGQGSCAHAGILSAFLAQKGFTGVKNVLQGKFGYYTCYHRGQYDPEVLTDGLGKSFEALDITFKRYPCCAHTHAPIEGTLKLMEKHHLKPEDIKEIHVGVNQQAFNIVADPLVVKRDPQDIAVAQFSIPYTQGTVVLKKKIFIDDFTPQAIRNPEVLKFAKKVNVYVDPEIQKKYPGVRSPAKVKLITQTGEALQENVDFIKGDPKSPLSMNELIDKFKACNSFARHPISDQSIKEVLEIVGNLEKLSDVNRLIQLLG
jgi:2-methylcitrate dehydratase PrpD